MSHANGPSAANAKERHASSASAGFSVDESSESKTAQEKDDLVAPLNSDLPEKSDEQQLIPFDQDMEFDENGTPTHPGYVPGKVYASELELEKAHCLTEEGYPEITDAAQEGRQAWDGKIEFLLTCVGYAVGLGNVWRFPYLCYKNGGGAFLLPYCLMLGTVGLPLFFLELSFGQFASLGPLTIWRISPLFKGLGISMVMVSLTLAVYYNIIVAQCLFFLVSSIVGPIMSGGILPWADCCNWWNTNRCEVFMDNETLAKNLTVCVGSAVSSVNRTRSPAEEFYEIFVLQKSTGLESMGPFNYKMFIALIAAWVIVCLVLLKGIQSLGKVSYFTAIFPYIMLTILLIRGATLPGAINGVIYYVKPDWERLKDYRVWMEAATQIFFSLSCCNGGLIAMSSYNKFRNNCQRDSCIVACINCGTSVFAGFVIFCNLGFMAHQKGVEVKDVAASGPGLAFVVYPEALTQMPLPALWAILFFIMMGTLGFGSQFSIAETVMSSFQDELKMMGVLGSDRWRTVLYRVLMCVLLCALGIPMTLGGGMYLLNLIDTVLASFPLMICGLFEILALMVVYGYRRVAQDIKLMVGGKPNLYWRSTWCVVCPLIMAVLLILMIAFNTGFTYDDYVYPPWANVLGQLIGVFTVIWIPAYCFYRFCKEGGLLLFREFLKPVEDWGPAKPKHRERFLETLIGGNGDSMDLEKASSFFQSKLSIAAELQRAASKESGLNRIRTHTNSFSAMHSSASNPQFQHLIDPTLVATAAQCCSSRDLQAPAAPSFAVGDDDSTSALQLQEDEEEGHVDDIQTAV